MSRYHLQKEIFTVSGKVMKALKMISLRIAAQKENLIKLKKLLQFWKQLTCVKLFMVQKLLRAENLFQFLENQHIEGLTLIVKTQHMNRIGRGLIFQSVESPNINYTVQALCSLSAEEKRHCPATCPCFCFQKCTSRAMSSPSCIPVRNGKMCRWIGLNSCLLTFLLI